MKYFHSFFFVLPPFSAVLPIPQFHFMAKISNDEKANDMVVTEIKHKYDCAAHSPFANAF